MEMQAVADKFDRDGDGFIDYKEFITALRPERGEPRTERPMTEGQRIHHELKHQEEMCTCQRQFRINKIGEGKYSFGESQKMRLVRILRSTVMVRVGGGWMALDEFLVKNDPCRAKGRTNLELREQFSLAEGVSQTMTGFKSRMSGRQSSPAATGSQHESAATHSSTAASASHSKSQRGVCNVHPDSEVRQILSPRTTVSKGHHRGSTGHLRDTTSPASPAPSHGSSRPSSRASVSSDVSESSDVGPQSPTIEVQTTSRTDTKSAGGRTTTTVTYQTQVAQTRTVTTPTAARASPSTSRLPKSTTPVTVSRRTPTSSSPASTGPPSRPKKPGMSK